MLLWLGAGIEVRVLTVRSSPFVEGAPRTDMRASAAS
jgi:hypothetical protein